MPTTQLILVDDLLGFFQTVITSGFWTIIWLCLNILAKERNVKTDNFFPSIPNSFPVFAVFFVPSEKKIPQNVNLF